MANFVISYRIKRLLGFIVLFGLTLGMPFSYAQDYDSEKDLQINAAKLFEKEEFVKAYPLYSQLLSVYPDNIKYNYKLSVCMLYANPDKEKAIPFLQRVTSNLNADKKSNYYMGVAYHLNYQFNKAISWYEKYLSSAPKKEALALNIKRKIQMCKNGLELMTHKSEISVLKKTEIKETEYFRSYDMSIFGGKLLVKPDDFKSAADKDKGERSIIYLGKDANMLFYSSYGTLGTNKDIYLVTKRDNGDWGAPKILSTTINTEYDEEYPVMYPNSNILYFCSKGHNSMGGYDIFKSEYDSSSGSWSKPINLDFAINSADDDILYLTTPDEMTAYFSSKRSSILGKINVYKVKLKKRPGEAPVIASAEDIISDETGELENIEEIQEIAQLNVNASEEDFVEPPTTTNETTETSTTREPATFTELSDEELIDAGKKYVLEIKEDQSKLSKEAEVSFSVASAKKEQSQEKLKEAETILARVENITDPDQKQLALQTAENLKEESARLERQSEIAFDMSKALAYDASIKQKELVTAENNAVRIESAVKSDQVDESISLLIEQKVLANSSSDSKVGVEEMTRKMKQDANLKESKASESYEKIQFMENEIAEINDEIVNLNEQAESTKDPTIKEEILRQAEELGVEMKDTEQELKQTYADAKEFEKEAEELKEEVALFTAVSSEVMQTSSDQISDASEAVAMTEIKEQPAEPTAETEPESSEVAMNTTESTEESTEETAPLVSIVSAEENTAETGLEANGENLSVEDLAKYDINEETINEALTNEEVKAEVQQVEKLQKEAEDYTAEATSIRERAETIEDPEFRENAIREAEKFETAAADKESEAATGQSSINYYNFQQNVNEFDEFASNNQYLSESDVASATLQKEKSNDLFEESKSARTKAKTLEDPEEKAVELDRARLLEQEAISVQREALNQLAVKENRVKLKEQKKMDSQMSDNDLAIINKLQEEAEDLYEESELVRLEASNINEPAAKIAQLNKATALGKKAVQKQKNALNNYEFQSNLTKLAEAASTSSEQLSPTQKTRLDILQEEFDDLLKQSVEARVDADDTASVIASADLLEKAVDLEELAIQKQFEVMGIYGIETPEPSADLALKTTTDESSLEAEEATLTPSSPASTDQAINATPETEASTEQTEMIEPEDPRSAEELISVSEAQKLEANRLYDQIEVIEDPILLMETLDKAEKLEKQAEVNMASARKKQQDAPKSDSETSGELALNTNEATETSETSETPEISENSEASETADTFSEAETETTSEPSSSSSELDTQSASSTVPSSASETNTETVSEPASTSSESSTADGSLGEETPEDIIAQIMAEEESEFTASENAVTSEAPASSATASSEPTAGTETVTGEETTYEPPISEEPQPSFAETYEDKEVVNIETYDELDSEPEVTYEAEASIEETSFRSPVVPSPLPATAEPLTEDIFTTATTNTYNRSNPIPVNRAVPSGLIFKVQVGAFRNPIPQNLFKGISPIMGENTAMGFIRYTAGLFKKIESADRAKSVIREYGFGDAFVVAFYNGNRISINEARDILNGGEAPAYALVTKKTGTGDAFSGGSTSAARSEAAGFGTTDLSSISKLLYTVQVGVYKNPTNIGEKYGLGKLNSINTSNGHIRYTYGIHDNINQANASKIIAVDNGISDAFVTAYYRGDRISLTKARTLELSNESEASTTYTEPAAAEATLDPASEVFKVQIGQFGNDVPVDASIAFFSLKELGIERHEQGELVIYTVGSFDNYNDAEELRKVVASKGVAEGSVVINRNDSIIPMEDFLKNSIDAEGSDETAPKPPIDEEPEPASSEDSEEHLELDSNEPQKSSPAAEDEPSTETENDADDNGPLTDDEFERELQKILDDDL